jgi:hypothetical protein
MAKRRWIIGVVLAAGLAAFALRLLGPQFGILAAPNRGPSQITTTVTSPPLSTFTSPRLMAFAQKVRYQIKIPPEWKVKVPGDYGARIMQGGTGATGATYWPLTAEMHSSGDMDGKLVVSHDVRQKGLWLPKATAFHWTEHRYSAQCDVRQEGRVYRIAYYHSNRAYFEATYRQICESFRVVRVK